MDALETAKFLQETIEEEHWDEDTLANLKVADIGLVVRTMRELMVACFNVRGFLNLLGPSVPEQHISAFEEVKKSLDEAIVYMPIDQTWTSQGSLSPSHYVHS